MRLRSASNVSTRMGMGAGRERSSRVQPGRHRHEKLPHRGVAGTDSLGGGRHGCTDPGEEDAQ
eukprot:1382428-Rhodomonas_salina.1